jgi:hypothetical protein
VTIAVRLLADLPHLTEPVARLRWQEWPGQGGLDVWLDLTRSEAGRDEPPVSWVAVDAAGEAVGAVALGPDEAAGPRHRGDRSGHHHA